MPNAPQAQEEVANQERWERALRDFDAIPKEQLTEEQIRRKAVALIGLKRYTEAREDLIALAKKGTGDPYVYYYLGLVYEKQKNPGAAIYFYRQSAKYEATAAVSKKKLYELSMEQEVDEASARVIQIKPFKSEISFKDVAGLEKIKERLFQKVILPLKRPDLLKKYGRRMNNGILLYGSPGGGKTYIAKAIAGEADAYMLVPGINQILGEFFGTSEKNLRVIFDQARNYAPCIIFFDEFDAIAGKRSSYGGSDEHGGTSSMKQIVNSLLTEMDGMAGKSEGIYIVATTNRPWDIDPGVKRSGRIGEMLYFKPPSLPERVEAFKYHLKNKRIQNINYQKLARATDGYSQSDIATICENATDIPILHEYKTNQEGSTTMAHLLLTIAKTPNTIDSWYLQARKELIGTYDTEIVDKKTIKKWKSAKLESQEQNEYREMIKDIKARTSPTAMALHKAKRMLSVYLG